MKFIPIEKMKALREAAKNGDEHAKLILKLQMEGKDFGDLLEKQFAVSKEPIHPEPIQGVSPIKEPIHHEPLEGHEPIKEDISIKEVEDDISDPKLKHFLEYNGVKKGDPEYESTIEAYYQEFPKARPASQKATGGDDVDIPNDNDSSSIYGEDDEPILEDEQLGVEKLGQEHHLEEDKCCLDDLIQDEYEAIEGYDRAISEISKMDESDAIKRGLIAKLDEIRRDEFEHVEELKRMKSSLSKKEEEHLE